MKRAEDWVEEFGGHRLQTLHLVRLVQEDARSSTLESVATGLLLGADNLRKAEGPIDERVIGVVRQLLNDLVVALRKNANAPSVPRDAETVKETKA